MRWNPTEVTSFWFLWERCLPLFRACVRFRKITETPPPCIYANGRRSQTRRSVVIAAALVYLHSASLDRPRAPARPGASPFHSWKKEIIAFGQIQILSFIEQCGAGTRTLAHREIGCPCWDTSYSEIRWWWRNTSLFSVDLNLWMRESTKTKNYTS